MRSVPRRSPRSSRGSVEAPGTRLPTSPCTPPPRPGPASRRRDGGCPPPHRTGRGGWPTHPSLPSSRRRSGSRHPGGRPGPAPAGQPSNPRSRGGRGRPVRHPCFLGGTGGRWRRPGRSGRARRPRSSRAVWRAWPGRHPPPPSGCRHHAAEAPAGRSPRRSPGTVPVRPALHGGARAPVASFAPVAPGSGRTHRPLDRRRPEVPRLPGCPSRRRPMAPRPRRRPEPGGGRTPWPPAPPAPTPGGEGSQRSRRGSRSGPWGSVRGT